jgi:hypothetical protein
MSIKYPGITCSNFKKRTRDRRASNRFKAILGPNHFSMVKEHLNAGARTIYNEANGRFSIPSHQESLKSEAVGVFEK